MDNKFFVVVGATGSGKDTLLERLMEHHRNQDSRDVPCDSTGNDRDTTSFTQIDISDCHSGSPMETLLFVWLKVYREIEYVVKPALLRGKRVIMKNFGGTAFVEAMVRAHSSDERERLFKMHKSFVENCVLGLEITPPIYLWLKVSPDVALKRRRADKTLPLNITEPLRYIADTNKFYEVYRGIPGQTVIEIDADRPIDVVFEDVCRIIEGKPLAIAA